MDVSNELTNDLGEKLYKRHVQGAFVRAGSSLIMWFFALVAYLVGAIGKNHILGISLSVLYLILINPPTLLLLKYITHKHFYKYGSLLINFLEIIGYTAIIYSLGGFEATYLTLLYAALITYVGVVAPGSFPYIIAAICSAGFGLVIASEYFGFLPPQKVDPFFNPPWKLKIVISLVAVGFLFVIAYISSLTSGILKNNRKKLQEQNIELKVKTDMLEMAQHSLKESENRFRELSIVDDLTNLFNSRHFYFQLNIEIERSNRYNQPLTLLLIDLDNFKAFNDAYGHIEGDQVLRRFGQVVKRCLRRTDFAFRYGGEEFTILLPMTTGTDGVIIAERIRATFNNEVFSPSPGKEVHLTLSIGLAQHRAQEEMKAFINRVDQLMYRGKKSGKDRICSDL